ncbi:diphthine--ammonia ligase [Candidatus Micrarchaeota archaeon]|nr:diphthine--ammonia ligase [Candidatus Micrarchaeota archaeon]
MRVAVLFLGGKDSVFATFWALTNGFDPILVTVEPPEYSMMFHHPNIKQTKKQAKVLGLKQVFVTATEDNWRDKLVATFRKLTVGGIVAGAIGSEYQRRRIDSIGEELGIPTYAPLWHKDMGIQTASDSELMTEMLEYFEIYITAVAADGLGQEFLGAPFKKLANSSAVKSKSIHPFLEGGEGETFVANAPFFKNRIKIKKWKKKWDGVRGTAELSF